MKKIAVFKRPERGAELTQTERELMMEKLRDAADIPEYHYAAFIEGELAAAAAAPMTTNVPAVILRRIISALRPRVIIAATAAATAIEIAMPFPMAAMNEDMTETFMIAANKPVRTIGIALQRGAPAAAVPIIAAGMTLDERIATGIYDARTMELSSAAPAAFELIVMFGGRGAPVATATTLDMLRLIAAYAAYRAAAAAQQSLLYLLFSAPPIGPDAAKRRAPRGAPAPAAQQTAMAKAFAGVYVGRLSGPKSAMIADIIAGRLWDAYVFMRTGDPRADAAMAAEKEWQRQHKQIRAYTREAAASAAAAQETQHYAWALFSKDAANITAAERKIINATKAAAQRGPKCEHTALVRRIHRSDGGATRFDAEAWDELKKILAPAAGAAAADAAMIECSVCGRPAICPHTRDVIEFNAASGGAAALRAMLMKKYVSATPTDDSYFCGVCGEKLATRFDERRMPNPGEPTTATAEQNPLSRQIWKEAMRTISEHMIFKTLFDTRAMAASIADSVQPFVEADIAAVRTVRTNNANTIKDATYLYISLYVFAALIHVIALHAADMRFKPGRGAGARGGAPLKLLQQLFGEALTIIVRTKTSIIERLPDINMNNIKSIFAKAYTNVSNLFVRTETIEAAPPENIVSDAVYQYLFRAKRKSAPNLRIGDTRRIFGIDIAAGKGISGKTLYDHFEMPPDWGPAAGPPRIGSSDEFDKKYHEFAYGSLIHMLKYAKHGTFRISPESEKHAADYARLRAAEIAIYAVLQRYSGIQFEHTRSREQYGAYHYAPTRISATYCPSGAKHDFTTHIFEHGLVRVDIPRGKMDKWAHHADYAESKHIGAKCAKCGVVAGAAAATAADVATAAAIAAKDKLVAFYMTFTYRCPNGGLHIYKAAPPGAATAAAPCAKCGITRTMIRNLDPAFAAAAAAPRQDKKNAAPRPQPLQPPSAAPQPQPLRAAPPPQQLPIADIARISKIPQETIAAIGALDGTIPLNHEGIWTHRAAIMAAHMTLFMIEYELFRGGSERSQFHEKWGTAAATLPPTADMFSGYMEGRDAARPPPDAFSFAAYHFMAALMRLFGHDGDAAKSIAHTILASAIKREQDTKHPGVLRRRRHEIEVEEGDAAEHEYADAAAADDDPFSLDGADIDKRTARTNSPQIDK